MKTDKVDQQFGSFFFFLQCAWTSEVFFFAFAYA